LKRDWVGYKGSRSVPDSGADTVVEERICGEEVKQRVDLVHQSGARVGGEADGNVQHHGAVVVYVVVTPINTTVGVNFCWCESAIGAGTVGLGDGPFRVKADELANSA
jgi:hypothetical protein